MAETFICFDCGTSGPAWSGSERDSFRVSLYTVYRAEDGSEVKVCAPCGSERDKARMRAEGKTCLYLSRDDKGWKVGNGSGSFEIRLLRAPRKSPHNIAGSRYDVWFSFEGQDWHGVNYGDMTQICHCRRVLSDKERAERARARRAAKKAAATAA